MEKKRKAGRPPKAERERTGHKGIIAEPENKENIIEMSYDNPSIFETMYASASRCSTSKIELCFEKDTCIIAVKGKKKIVSMRIDFRCNNLLSYYCGKNMYYEGECENILKIIKTKNKEDNRIIMSIPENKLNEMKITFKKSTESLTKSWRVPLDIIEKPDLESSDNIYKNIHNYPLSFRLNWTVFKRMISSWKKFKPEDIYIEKDVGAEPLKFQFQGTIIGNDSDFGDSEEIKLKFTGEEIFSVKIPLNCLTPIASSDGLSNYIYFYADEKEALVCEGFVDQEYDCNKQPKPLTEVATVRFFTEISEI